MSNFDLTYLQHYGVKGMQWGIRRTPQQLGHESKNKAIRQKRKKDLAQRRTMSDEELSSKIKRLGLEQKYKDLATKDLYPGKSVVNDVLESSGRRIITSAVTGAVAYAGYSVMSNKFNWEQAAGYMFPNPNKKK